MKYIYLGILLILCGCTQVELMEETGTPKEVTVAIQLKTDESLRATSSDLAIKSAEVLVYNSNEVLENSVSLKSGVTSATLTMKEGKKYIYVVANASTTLVGKIKAAHYRSDLLALTSEAGDYNNGQLPSQGLLMSGEHAENITTNKSVTVTLTAVLAKIEVYVAKASNVGNITVKGVKGINLHNTGYLFGTKTTTSKSSPAMKMPSSTVIINTNDAAGKLVGTAYSYPTSKATDLSVQLTVRHTEAQADDVYTIVPNANNSSADGVTFERGKHYKVTVTFERDEQGTIKPGVFTEVDNGFTFG